jgi:hypothetical protein
MLSSAVRDKGAWLVVCLLMGGWLDGLWALSVAMEMSGCGAAREI